MKTIVKQKSRYELQRLENVIIKDLALFFKHTPDLEHEFLPDFLAIVNEEVQSVKENLTLSPLAFDKPADRRRYIRYHHHALLTLAGQLLRYATPADLDHVRLQPGPQTLSQILYHAIEDLLDFIRTHFPQHIDQDAWLPVSYQLIVRYRLCNDLPTLRTALLRRGVSLDLVAVAMLPLTQLTGDTDPNHVTHRTVAYLDQLKKRLFRLAASPVGNPNRQLVELLCELNFNSPEFVAYCIAYMKYDLRNVLPTADGGPMVLYRFRKLLLQIQPASAVALHPSLPPLQERLCAWIDAELSYSESTLRPPNATPVPDGLGLISKIIIILTGGQLSYFFGVMLEEHIVTNKNKTQLGRILSAVFHTTYDGKKADSYRQQFYRGDLGIMRAVESVLDRMLQRVRKDIAKSVLP
ncbi:hypothetical protein [Dawidia soli]|uniref:Uncharacterized protein n=1 Tax=Dawidia soli TaxID=2782352 RepID=A0AAP2DEY1_9BACT|nr:hypothetical protein [Dawidia soli]MBT1690489.1 hypothetical protein [Dawidia soli]